MYGLLSGMLTIGTTSSMAMMHWYLEEARPSGVLRAEAENDIRRELRLSEVVPSLERSVPSATLGVYLGVKNAKLRF
ncbi:hypothetical protein M407DRAFT_242927 [Tulasnella calospora MUT 4182]|uniref:Uncharacterized protein n=1 Tax=Tulasnella calospora MUT 4182 TaxID=1051891 RepID=A0A0C3L4J3_9AGAM|nr:hypothetical protein M407DRAFT_242927 [Tulasnella calospora MUT 4182]